MTEPTHPEAVGVTATTAAPHAGPQPAPTKKKGGEGRSASLWADAWRDLRRKPLFWTSSVVIVIMTSMAVIPWLWTSRDPTDCGQLDIAKQGPTREHIFGMNELGCDYYSMAIYGARPSIAVAFLSTLGVGLIGGLLGILSAYYGGWVDTIISRFTDVVLGLPFLLGAIVILAMLDVRTIWTIVLVLVALGWTGLTRIMRGSVLATKNADYVHAARALGASDARLILRHILPNAMAPVIVVLTIALGGYVSAEATLTYLGVGLDPSKDVSWGGMINRGDDWIFEHPHLLLFPCGLLIVTVLSFILLGDALRDALDPKLR
jgi:peptide/nickel transport system permease protein/oligopeptide transport system permease protein